MSENKPKFQKLTPIDNADIGIYSDALDYVFENNDLRNVAISGAYSAGKSSVLASYKAKHSDKKFLHISLTHFEETNEVAKLDNTEQKAVKTVTADKPIAVKESVLEGKILNQLIHQISPNRIPQTNFRVKRKVEPKKIIVGTIGAVVFLLSLLHIIFFGNWQNYVARISTMWIKSALSLTAKNSSVLLTGAISVALAGFLLYHLIKIQINKGIFKKISANKFEIEIFEKSEDSYFDKYLNEVLYLFDQCEADVIVFEDMDRYSANRIFERLREVNNLINVQRSKESDRKPLRFFYLLRDDIFVSKDRTKFFDFIVPVIPVVDGSNSYDQFIAHLTASGVLELFDEPFLQGLSLYIDDMRILKNICNEFLIYNSRLNITELNHNKLMAMIAYKNLFPRDFNDLQLGKGFVFTLFDKKDQFIANKIATLDSELKVAEERLEAAKKEHLASIHELDIVKADEQTTISNTYRSYSQNQQRQEATQKLEEKHATRKQAIEDRNENQMLSLETEIYRLKRKITVTKNEALHKIITRENISEIFSVTSVNEINVTSDFKDIRGNVYFALLKYLVRNGYIDESYADYMTYFYEKSLSRTDKIFLRSISDQNKKEFDYNLKESQKIVARLDVSVFDQPEVLNYDLLFYLLQACGVMASVPPIYHPPEVPTFPTINLQKQKEPQLLTAMVELILSQDDYAFLNSVFQNIQNERLNYLVNLLNKTRKDCLKRILCNKAEFIISCRDDFVFRTLIITPDEDLMGSEEFKKALVSYVSNQADFLNADWLSEEKLQLMFGKNIQAKLIRVTLLTRFETLGICFHAIKYETADIKLFEQVYAHSYYALNYENIALMLQTKYGINESDDFKHKNYSLVRTKPDSPLAVYTENNIDDYIAEVIENCDGKISDNESDVKDVLNNENVSGENKTAYIGALTTVIQNIIEIDDTKLWKQMLKSELVTRSEKNVLDYYCACGHAITDELLAFLNGQDNKYDYTEVRSGYENDIQSKFFVSVLQCNKLNNGHYGNILKTLGRSYNNGFNVENVASDKVLILIDIGAIPMHKESLLFLRDHYPDAVMPYIQKYIAKYVDEILDDENFDLNEVLSVLLLSVADKYKLSLLERIDDSITARRQQYSDTIKAHILLNNLEESDISHFIASYPSEGDLTKAAIEKIAVDEIQSIFDEEYCIDKDLVDKLIASDVTYNVKVKLFALLLPSLDEHQCKDYLRLLGLNNYLRLFEQKRPKIEISPINTRLLGIFRQKDWITKFEEDDRNNTYYRVYGRKSHKDAGKDEVTP